MVENIFEQISRSKKGRLQASNEEWDGIIETFNRDIVQLKDSYKNWKVELEGTHSTADLSRPSSLPFGEKIDWMSVNIRGTHPNKLDNEYFEVTQEKTFFKLKSKFLVKSKSASLRNRLYKSQTLLKFYSLPFTTNPKIIGKTIGNLFVVESQIFADSNQKELVKAFINALEEVMDILELSYGSSQ